ncbi:MAG: hypothetical protein SFY68_05485 [Candidatus Sumerlaeia bacterium]|nr:hypothetical protein [Candidatus Sumerlaeia bacterium]
MSKVAAKASSKASSSVDVAKQLEAIQKAELESQQKFAEQKKQLLKEVLDAKREEIRAAKAALREAENKVYYLEQELEQLLVSSGEKKAKVKTRKSSGAPRKPRVSVEEKKKQVEKLLSTHTSKISFNSLKAALLDLKDPETGFSYFAVPDFASSKVFASKYLPKGWKMTGERRNAELTPTK